VVKPRVLDLNAVVADVEQLLRRTIGADIRLVTRCADGLPPVNADPGHLEQVLVNLAVNARDAMPDGGTLAIETDAVTIDEHYATLHPGAHPGDYVRLRVSDTGTGMSKDTVDRAFEPFFTTKPKGQGTGLGLATIYGIVTKAGGHVQIYSELGTGTTITVLLPRADADAVERPAPAAPPRAGRGETILLVEDEPSLRAVTERILVRAGYRVLTAPDGAEAITVAAHHDRIDLLLTDVVMPHMPGSELAQHLCAARPGLPVVFLSGYAEPILNARTDLSPDVTLLTKPVTELALLAAVADTLDAAGAAIRPG
jgi:two-component system cell cycle sensor histidine kinase/response regulator CckA